MKRRWLAALVLALALASGESATGVLGFFVAHWVFLQRRPLREFLPIGLAVLGWFVLYRSGNHGVKGSAIYTDPMHSPLKYAAAALEHVPVLLGVELGAPPPDGFPFFPFALRLVFVAIALGFVAWTVKLTPRTRTAGFFALGAVLAVLPSAATFPAGRLLLIGGFGLVAVVALICIEVGPKASRAFKRWAWFTHAIIGPLFFVVNLHGMELFDHMLREYGKGIPVDGSAEDKRIVLVNAPDTAFMYYIIVNPMEEGLKPPRTMLAMATNQRDLKFTRTGDATFTMHEENGFYREGTEILFCDPAVKMHEGQIVEQSDTRITIMHVMTDGVPDEVKFELKQPLDHYLFREWRGKTLVPYELPAIGETVTFKGRMMDIL